MDRLSPELIQAILAAEEIILSNKTTEAQVQQAIAHVASFGHDEVTKNLKTTAAQWRSNHHHGGHEDSVSRLKSIIQKVRMAPNR